MADTTPEHAHEEQQEYKNHGDPLDHTEKTSTPEPHDPVPMPDTGGHSKSHAAHLGGHVDAHTKPASADLRHGMTPGERREPPMVQSRIGKQHK